ncbi:MAG: DNA-binding protein [Nitrospirae bacterium]|nr:DNA-binding protein [Magnetococcales bacterium]
MSPYNKAIKERNFLRPGITVKDWAQARGFRPYEVYRVLSGRLKTNYGRAHEIAVALGMKPGTTSLEIQS